MERNVGQEEKILDELTSFAADQGFILPTPETESSVVNIRQSTASLNIVLSENEETTSALWDRIRTMIGKGLLASLDKMKPSMNQLEIESLLTQVRFFVYILQSKYFRFVSVYPCKNTIINLYLPFNALKLFISSESKTS